MSDLERMRINEIHMLYRYIFDFNAKVTEVNEIEGNIFLITLGWRPRGDGFWSERTIVLQPIFRK